MAFRPEDMGVIGYCNGFTMWYYPSKDDTYFTISADGYFNKFARDLRVEDLIFFTDNQGRSGIRRINQLSNSMVRTAKPV
jgi:hypothetical protein